MKRWQAVLLFLTWLLVGTDFILRAPRPARALRGLVSTGLVKDFGPFARGALSGTSPYDGNYIPGFVNNAIQPIPALPAGEFIANAIYFLPFSTNQTMQFNQVELSVRALSAAGGKCRFALYDSRSSTDLFPKNLLAQSAADLRVDQGASIATGGCDGTGSAVPCLIVDGLSVTMTPSRLYWMALWCNAQFSMSYFPLAASWEFAGINTSLDTFSNAYRVPITYTGTFPNPISTSCGVGTFCGVGCAGCTAIALDKLPMMVVSFQGGTT